MKLPPSICEAIKTKNIDAVRVEIQELVRTDCCAKQPQALRVADMVAESLTALYEKDDGHYSSFDWSNLTEDTWSNSRAALRLNFSREKLLALSDMTLALRKQGIEHFKLPRRNKLMIGLVALTVVIVIVVIASLLC